MDPLTTTASKLQVYFHPFSLHSVQSLMPAYSPFSHQERINMHFSEDPKILNPFFFQNVRTSNDTHNLSLQVGKVRWRRISSHLTSALSNSVSLTRSRPRSLRSECLFHSQILQLPRFSQPIVHVAETLIFSPLLCPCGVVKKSMLLHRLQVMRAAQGL